MIKKRSVQASLCALLLFVVGCTSIETVSATPDMIVLRWDPAKATLRDANTIALNRCLTRRRITRFIYIDDEPDGFKRAGFRCVRPNDTGSIRLPS